MCTLGLRVSWALGGGGGSCTIMCNVASFLRHLTYLPIEIRAIEQSNISILLLLFY